jgi:hypothetical protein
MSAFHALLAELKAQRCLDLVQKCLGSGALTLEQAKKVAAEINSHAVEDIVISKAIPPGPPLTEIVKRGYFSELPKRRSRSPPDDPAHSRWAPSQQRRRRPRWWRRQTGRSRK